MDDPLVVSRFQKRRIVESLTDTGGTAQVLINAQNPIPGLSLPDYLIGNSQVVLNLSWAFGVPMSFTEEGFTAKLSFDGKPFDCEVPWNLVYGIIDPQTGINRMLDVYAMDKEIRDSFLDTLGISPEELFAEITDEELEELEELDLSYDLEEEEEEEPPISGIRNADGTINFKAAVNKLKDKDLSKGD